MPEVHPGERAFLAERDRLWGLAYRICGTRTDADDVVQDAWLRWNASDDDVIERPAAWLTTVTSRLAIDRLRSRRRATERYVGPWLPEMVVAPQSPDATELVDSMTVGFLTMLERLEPIERVVFLLADVFAESFADIAITVDRSEVACRQIASRARRHVHDGSRQRSVSAPEQRRLAAAFAAAVSRGDLDAVKSLLAGDAVLLSDGGATVHAARRPVVGADRIARFMINLVRRVSGIAGVRFEPATINGEPGVLTYLGEELLTAMVVHAELDDSPHAVITNVFMLRSPEKLDVLRG